MFYCGVRMAFNKGLLINPKEKDAAKKAEIEKQTNEAYANMLAGCANRIGDYLTEGIQKAKK